MKLTDTPITLGHLRSKYYRAFRRRISSKTGHLVKADRDKKIIARLRAELKRISFKFRAVFDHSHSYFIILDKKMNIVDFNKASMQFVKNLFGKKMVAGDNILNFLHPSSAKMVTENCDRALAGEKFAVEKKICAPDKIITWWSFEFSPATNLRGHVTGLVFNANDITRRKDYEAKIASQRKKLDEIAALQSHEIRGPVSTIMGLMSLIKDENYPPDKECLLLLEVTAELLDKNIHDIVARANDDNDG